MLAKSRKTDPAAPAAKLFMHGRGQAVRLPKAFGFEGTEVRVSKVGDKVILEPVPFDFDAWLAKLETYMDHPFPEVEDDILIAAQAQPRVRHPEPARI